VNPVEFAAEVEAAGELGLRVSETLDGKQAAGW
jgi:hypothetical protein